MSDRRSAERRHRQSMKTAPNKVADTAQSSAPAQLAGPETTVARSVDPDASDVIVQRAMLRATPTDTASPEISGTPRARSTGQRRVSPTAAHLGDRSGGPVSGISASPISSRGPGLAAPTPLPSVIVSPRLSQTEPPLATAAPAKAEPPLATAAPGKVEPPLATAPSASRATIIVPPTTAAITGPSIRPTKTERRSTRPGVLLLAAAAVFAIGYVALRGPTTSSSNAATAKTTVDRAERLESASLPASAPAARVGLEESAPAAAANLPATAPAAVASVPKPDNAEPPRTAPVPEPASAPTVSAAVTPPPAATRVDSPQGVDEPTPSTARTEPTERPDAVAKTTPKPANRPTQAAKATPAVANRPAPTAQADLATRLDDTDPGARYADLPPKAAGATPPTTPARKTAASPITPPTPPSDERRYDHVPPKAAQLAGAPAAQLAKPPATPEPDERRYDHVPPKAAQLAPPTAPKDPVAVAPKPVATPLSGTPRIYLQSDPPGATVAILGQARGKTPISLDLDGPVEATLTHPERKSTTITLEPGRGARWLSITLDPR